MSKKFTFSISSVPRILAIGITATILLSILWVTYYSQFEVKNTPQMALYKFDKRTDSVQLKVEYEWVPISEISRNMVVAALAAQDVNFYVHDGFIPVSDNDTTGVEKTAIHETITQRAAHAVFLTKGDSRIKDILEPYFTVLTEYAWGKDRILEVYLNTVLLGNGIFGVEAASHIYFNKSAADLTKQEAAFIASLMELPETINPEQLSEELLARQKIISLNMALMMHVKIGKKPIDEAVDENKPSKPSYKRNWRG